MAKKTGAVVSSVWGVLRGSLSGRFSLAVLAVWVLLALVSLVWTPYPLLDQEKGSILAAPSWRHPLGTDAAGADVVSWLLKGSSVELAVAALVVFITFLIGSAGIALTVSSHRIVSRISTVAIDTLIAVPTIVIAMVIAVPFGASIAVVVIACSCAYSFTLMRIVRPQALLAVSSDYVEAARWAGAGDWTVFRRHVLPSVAPMMIIELSHCAGTAVLAEVGLTYLGVGMPSDIPSWGHTLATSSQLISVYPLTVVWSGLCVAAGVSALNIMGDSIREAADPVTNPRLRSAVGGYSPCKQGEKGWHRPGHKDDRGRGGQA